MNLSIHAGILQVLQGGRVDWTVWLIRIFVLLLSLSVHEYSHAKAAYKLGDDTAALQGRLTLNPAAHLDPVGTLLIVLGAPVAWAKPVPIQPARFKEGVTVKKGMMLTAIAGPVSNIILAAVSYFLHGATLVIWYAAGGLALTGIAANILDVFLLLFGMMFVTNLYLAVFNILPVPPLDGSRILSMVLPDKAYYSLLKYERYIGLAFLALLILVPGVLTDVLSFVSYPIRWLIETPVDLLTSWIINFIG